MWYNVLCTSLLLTAIGVTSLDVDCEGNCTTGVNLGYYANSGDFPYQLLVSWFDSEPKCSAVLITYSFAVTSASCVAEFGDVQSFWKDAVLYGSGMALLYEIGNITDTAVHPEFKHADSTNDIALIKFTPAITEWNPLLAPIALAKVWPGKDNIMCKVSSWWQGDMTGKWADRLLWREIRLRSCTDVHNENSDLMCSASAYGGTSPVYPKDVGSPVICNGVLTGIVPNSDEPGYITNLTYHSKWILQMMRTLGSLNTTIEVVPLPPTTVVANDHQAANTSEIMKLLHNVFYIVSNISRDSGATKVSTTVDTTKSDKDTGGEQQKDATKTPSDFFSTYTILPLNYVLFATMILLFIIVCYNTLFSVILVHCSRK